MLEGSMHGPSSTPSLVTFSRMDVTLLKPGFQESWTLLERTSFENNFYDELCLFLIIFEKCIINYTYYNALLTGWRNTGMSFGNKCFFIQ